MRTEEVKTHKTYRQDKGQDWTFVVYGFLEVIMDINLLFLHNVPLKFGFEKCNKRLMV